MKKYLLLIAVGCLFAVLAAPALAGQPRDLSHVDEDEQPPVAGKGKELAEAYNDRGWALVDEGRIEEALEDFQKAAAADPESVDALLGLGYCLLEQGDAEGARDAYNQAVGLDPKQVDGYAGRGWALYDLGEFRKAAADFQKASGISPEETEYRLGLGWSLYELEDLGGAEAAFKEAVRLDPGEAEAHAGLGLTLEKKGDPESALKHYNDALSVDPESLDALLGRGWLRLAGEDYKAALADFDQAARVDPEEPDAHMGRSEALEGLGHKDEALSALNEYIRLQEEGQGGATADAKTAGEESGGFIRANPSYDPSAIPLPQSERRVALVIGNGAYVHFTPLRNPANDARDMAEALSKTGFEVNHLADAGRTEMLEAVREFGRRLRLGGVGLFFYAGHGVQVKGENYLVPVDADIRHEDEVEDRALRASAVLRKMETAGNRLNIIILDACRNNPLPSGSRDATGGLARMEAPKGSLLVYATAPGATASDGKGSNGLFTSKLIKYIQTPGVPIESVLKRVRVEVMEESGGAQVPWESSSLTGEFLFIPQAANKVQ